MRKFHFGNFMLRWLIAAVLVGLTYNPTGYSFYHWVAFNPHYLLPLKILAGLVLLVAYIVFLRSTWRSIGALGIFLTLAICGTLVWLLIDLNWLSVNRYILIWIGLAIISVVMAVGISWSHFRRRWTGQIDADDVDS